MSVGCDKKKSGFFFGRKSLGDDGNLRRFQAESSGIKQELLKFVQRPSRLWSILEVDSADAQRDVAARCSEGKGVEGEKPHSGYRLPIDSETQAGNAPVVL